MKTDEALQRVDGRSERFARNEVEGDESGCPLGERGTNLTAEACLLTTGFQQLPMDLHNRLVNTLMDAVIQLRTVSVFGKEDSEMTRL